jgi:hypothetical protein
VYEALSSRLPVVAANVLGMASLVDDRVGFVVSASESGKNLGDLLARKVLIFMDNMELVAARGTAGRNKVLQSFGASSFTDAFLAQLAKASNTTDEGFGLDLFDLIQGNTQILETQANWVDLGHFAYEMSLPPRSGVGLAIRQSCGEYSSTMSTWISSVSSPKLCANAQSGDPNWKQVLASVAPFQCGAWCIFDPRIPKGGWFFNGNCFAAFGPESDCETNYPHLRAQVVKAFAAKSKD